MLQQTVSRGGWSPWAFFLNLLSFVALRHIICAWPLVGEMEFCKCFKQCREWERKLVTCIMQCLLHFHRYAAYLAKSQYVSCSQERRGQEESIHFYEGVHQCKLKVQSSRTDTAQAGTVLVPFLWPSTQQSIFKYQSWTLLPFTFHSESIDTVASWYYLC